MGLKSDGMGPVMASWGDVNAWCEAADVDAEPWERRALIRLSYERAQVMTQKAQKEAARGRPGQA